MANEAATTIYLRMHDEASTSMENFRQTTTDAQLASLEFNTALTAMGSALTGVGSLLNQLDTPAAKIAGTFITTAGAIMSTTAAIIMAIPQIKALITWLRSLAVAQAFVQALSGIGIGTVVAGLAVGGAAAAAVYGATGGFSGGGGTTVNINTQAFVGNDANAREFASKVQRFNTEAQRTGRG